ncbi:hypothetical protein SBA4_2960020 [Candidatus Sulfopaludibacter sp. SbA4]|nr:hypothetical protein SBA4_2960020 [Candidatus Sulfopaludibacter sp. SbA4]
MIRAFDSRRSNAAQTKPMTGETSKDIPTSDALAQFTPSPNTCPFAIAELAKPTPIIDPISV